MEEVWKPIPGYEGLYDASSLGRIRSTPGKVTSSARFSHRVWQSRIMKEKIHGRGNRKDARVELWNGKEHHTLLVARLVASAFHGVPPSNMTVNHINGNSLDNRVKNLEWVSRAENNRHAHDIGLCASYECQVGLIDNHINLYCFPSQMKACKFLGRNDGYISTLKKRGKVNAISIDGAVFRVIPLEDYWRCDSGIHS